MGVPHLNDPRPGVSRDSAHDSSGIASSTSALLDVDDDSGLGAHGFGSAVAGANAAVGPPPASPDRSAFKKQAGLLKDNRSTRFALKHRRGETEKSATREICVYFVFLVFFTIVLFVHSTPYAFWYADLMEDLLLREEFQYQDSHVLKTFYDVGDLGELWQWMQGPMLNGLYAQELYDGYLLDDSMKDTYIFGTNLKVGLTRIRQKRVFGNTCKLVDAFQSTITTCYGDYSKANERTTPLKRGNTTYSFNHAYDEEPFSYGGRIGSYDSGGYYVDLPKAKASAAAVLAELRESAWIDLGTRVVFVDFTLYNPAIKLFLICRVLGEFPPSGGVIPSATFRVAKLFRYETPAEKAVLFPEFVLVLFVLYYIYEEFSEMVKGRREYFRDKWNYADLLNLVIFCTSIAFRVFTVISVDPTFVGSAADKYVSFQTMGFLVDQERNLNAFNAFLCYLKMFKYLSISPRMSQLSLTLSNAAWDISFFIVMFGIVFIGFAFAGFVVFGVNMYSFRTVYDSIFNLFTILLGDFEFSDMYETNRLLGPLFFISFQVLVVFILTNMFLAIITESYQKVRSTQANLQSVNEMLREQFGLLRRGAWELRERQHLKYLKKIFETADLDGDSVITRSELTQAVRRIIPPNQQLLNPEEEAARLFEMFDLDKNDKVDMHEAKVALVSLKKRAEKLEREAEGGNRHRPSLVLSRSGRVAAAQSDDEEGMASGDGDSKTNSLPPPPIATPPPDDVPEVAATAGRNDRKAE